ncbi:hypothetical protein, partial [Streptococcus agalactiae]|uniref:hypothetical protein n=1 Tax=Streptococcus agalactiae TaxID=1311 RepID=UPI001A7E8663
GLSPCLPELVSGPIVPAKPKPRGEKWTLKRVQGDGWIRRKGGVPCADKKAARTIRLARLFAIQTPTRSGVEIAAHAAGAR